MALPVVIQKRQPGFFDESYTQPPVSVPNNATLQRLCQIRCRTGLKPYLTVYAQQIDAAGVNYVTWHLYRNGQPFYPYHAHQNQTAAPQDNVKLPVPLPLEQDDLIEVYAELAAGAGAAQNAIARLLVEYDDLE